MYILDLNLLQEFLKSNLEILASFFIHQKIKRSNLFQSTNYHTLINKIIISKLTQ